MQAGFNPIYSPTVHIDPDRQAAKERGKFTSFSIKERQNLPVPFYILLFL
jgi:hypothetical protein